MKNLVLILSCMGLVALFSASTAQAQTSEWKEVTPSAPSGGGGGGASYTAWGTTTCATGWDVAYTGTVVSMFSYQGVNVAIALSNVICAAGNKTMNGSGGNSAWTGGYFESGNSSYTEKKPCAVCVK